MLYFANTPYYPTPDLINQYCTFHLGKVVNVNDPEGRGRIKAEVPGLLGKGKENWTDWIEIGGTPVGGTKDPNGDEGIWWPMQVGQTVMIGFVSGDPFALWAIPGPPCQRGEGKDKQLTPAEAKNAGRDNPRDATRVRMFKTESGHTILFDDRGKKEKMMICDWTGAGMFFSCPGKQEDEQEGEEDESKRRKAENRRKSKLTANNTAEKPGKLMRTGRHISAFFGLTGSGWCNYCTDDESVFAVYNRDADGKIKNSIVCDSLLDEMYLTSGEMQIQILGGQNKIAVTRQIIQNAEKVPIEDVIEDIIKQVAKEFEDYKE